MEETRWKNLQEAAVRIGRTGSLILSFLCRRSIPYFLFTHHQIHRLQEGLEIELDCADGIRQLELLQDAGVQDAEDTDGVVLAAKVDFD